MNRRMLLRAAALAPLAAIGPAFGQVGWPDRVLRIVVPFVPGSFTDVSARLLANELTEQLGQPVVIENRGGAGGTAGTVAVVRAAAPLAVCRPAMRANPAHAPRRTDAAGVSSSRRRRSSGTARRGCCKRISALDRRHWWRRTRRCSRSAPADWHSPRSFRNRASAAGTRPCPAAHCCWGGILP